MPRSAGTILWWPSTLTSPSLCGPSSPSFSGSRCSTRGSTRKTSVPREWYTTTATGSSRYRTHTATVAAGTAPVNLRRVRYDHWQLSISPTSLYPVRLPPSQAIPRGGGGGNGTTGKGGMGWDGCFPFGPFTILLYRRAFRCCCCFFIQLKPPHWTDDYTFVQYTSHFSPSPPPPLLARRDFSTSIQLYNIVQ